VWIVDTKKEHIAISEARKLNIPVVAILDTNCDPDEVDYPIPGNDDAIRSVSLLTRVIADAVADGLLTRSGAGEQKAAEEPLAEWEREILEGKTETADSADVEKALTEAPAETPAPEVEAAIESEAPAVEETPAPEAEAPAADEAPAAEAEAPAADEKPASE
jgi:small subunit ribosomal protein S2